MESKKLHLRKSNLLVEYFDSETSGETLLFLGGYDQPFSVFKNLFSLISKDYRIIALNMPGIGETEPVDKISINICLNIVDEFAAEKNLDNFFIMGNSFGGYLALRYAHDFNCKNIKGVILLAPYFVPYTRNLLGNLTTVLKTNLRKTFNRHGLDSINFDDEGIFKQTPKVLMDYAKMILGIEFEKSLLSLKKDCLIIFGDKDTLIDSSYTMKLLKDQPNIQLEKIENPMEIEVYTIPLYKRLIYKFKKDKIAKEITFGSHDCYMEIGEKILVLLKNFTSNYA
jgi:pimeloyl-ACP methyl ester carboxylesterase